MDDGHRRDRAIMKMIAKEDKAMLDDILKPMMLLIRHVNRFSGL